MAILEASETMMCGDAGETIKFSAIFYNTETKSVKSVSTINSPYEEIKAPSAKFDGSEHMGSSI